MPRMIRATAADSTIAPSLAVTLSKPMRIPATSRTQITTWLVGTDTPPQMPPMMAKSTPTTNATLPTIARALAIPYLLSSLEETLFQWFVRFSSTDDDTALFLIDSMPIPKQPVLYPQILRL